MLVNNAGMIRRAPAAETTAEDWHEVIALNLTAPFFLAQAFGLALLGEGGRGSIINVVSMNSFHGGMEVPAYTAPSTASSGSRARWRTSGRRAGSG